MNKRPRQNTPAAQKSFKKPRPALARQASQMNLMRQANTVRGGPEKKNIDNAQNLTVPIAGTAIQSGLLTPIAQGATANSRIGRKVKLVKFTLRWTASLAGTSVGGSPLRIKVVYDKQTNGAAMATTDVVIVDELQSPNNLDNSDRFITLVDEITEPISVGNNFSIAGQFNRKIDLEQLWVGNNAGGAIGQLLTGSVYLFVWQTTSITTAAPTFNYYARTRFEDN